METGVSTWKNIDQTSDSARTCIIRIIWWWYKPIYLIMYYMKERQWNVNFFLHSLWALLLAFLLFPGPPCNTVYPSLRFFPCQMPCFHVFPWNKALQTCRFFLQTSLCCLLKVVPSCCVLESPGKVFEVFTWSTWHFSWYLNGKRSCSSVQHLRLTLQEKANQSVNAHVDVPREEKIIPWYDCLFVLTGTCVPSDGCQLGSVACFEHWSSNYVVNVVESLEDYT